MSRSVDKLLLVSLAGLLLLGCLMVYSSTAIIAEQASADSLSYLKRHLVHAVLGFICLTAFALIPLRVLRSMSPYFLGAVTLMLIAVAIPHFGEAAGGARRWLGLGPLRFQPGEVIKFALVFFIADYIGKHHDKMRQFKAGVIIPFAVVGCIGVLLLLQPDFGSTVVIFSITFFQLLCSSSLIHLFSVGLVSVVGFLGLAVTSPYRFKRLKAFLDPFSDPAHSGYQLIQSLIAVGSGGLFGLGLGAGKQKLYYLPAAHTDFIFAVICEELGLIGALATLGLFMLFLWRALLITRRFSADVFLFSLGVGCTLLVVFPALLNMAVVLGLLPTKGMVLPLVSYGGSAMLVNLSAVGILLNISRLPKT